MAKTTPTAETPTAETPAAETPAADAFAGLAAFAADAWEPPPVQPSDAILTFAKQLIEHGKAAVNITDWPGAKVRQFKREVKAAVPGGNVAFKLGRLKDGTPGLRVNITTPRTTEG